MRYLGLLFTFIVVFLVVQGVSAGPGKPASSASKAVAYTAYNQEDNGGNTRISLTLSVEPRGKEFEFTGTMTFVTQPVRKLAMKGAYDPTANRLQSNWSSSDMAGRPGEYDITGSQRPDGVLEVDVHLPAAGDTEAVDHHFHCLPPGTGLLDPFPKRPARPANLTKKGLWYGLVEITLDPKKISGSRPWDVLTDQKRQEHGMCEVNIQRRKVKWTQTWLDDKGNVKGEWICNWTYDEPPAIFALGPRYKLKMTGTCEIRKSFEPTYYDMFSCWMEARYDTDKTENSPDEATWNGLPAKWPKAFLGLANMDSLGSNTLVTGGVINRCEGFWDTDLLDAFGDSFTVRNWNSPPEYLHFKVRVGSIVAIYKYKLRTKPTVKPAGG